MLDREGMSEADEKLEFEPLRYLIGKGIKSNCGLEAKERVQSVLDEYPMNRFVKQLRFAKSQELLSHAS